MLKAIAQGTRTTAEAKASAVVDELRGQRTGRATEIVDAYVAEILPVSESQRAVAAYIVDLWGAGEDFRQRLGELVAAEA